MTSSPDTRKKKIKAFADASPHGKTKKVCFFQYDLKSCFLSFSPLKITFASFSSVSFRCPLKVKIGVSFCKFSAVLLWNQLAILTKNCFLKLCLPLFSRSRFKNLVNNEKLMRKLSSCSQRTSPSLTSLPLLCPLSYISR